MSTIRISIDMPINGGLDFTRDVGVDATFATERWQEAATVADELERIAHQVRNMWPKPVPTGDTCNVCGVPTFYGKIHFHNSVVGSP